MVRRETMKRILLLTQWFDPEPTAKGLPFAKELVRKGHDVEVVTGFPNYPDGKLYPGYRMSWLKRETVDGVRVTRLPLYPSHDASACEAAHHLRDVFRRSPVVLFCSAPNGRMSCTCISCRRLASWLR